MALEINTLRIKAERLGTVNDVISLLSDIEFAYNSIYTFNFLVDSLAYNQERNNRYAKELLDYYKHDFPRYIFINENILNKPLPNLIELQKNIDFEKIILPDDKLVISKVNIQSPGFWEFVGSLNPLQQMREYLNDRHERQKDRKYRNRQEEELGNLEIQDKKNKLISQRIDILKNAGYSDIEIRQMVNSMINLPLNKLGEYQDKGQIEESED
ncbi:hypothetical protein [Elizabethkingia meningoseptica]|uniref:hypothetical protein n=1 Tax=Elizabethkingia meningoseptica TaxID=238 RepID=UPI000936DC90|nr:hypothetical protein [Elizabethkingia meningoseptica]MDE5487303.1 hypothetical protein [Elizabethkingia meningoseptica]MVW93859.1 hypothetical protein [Elizabethkingia meningoseptica]